MFLTLDEALPYVTGSMHVYPCANCGYFHIGHPARGATRKKKHDRRFRFTKFPHNKRKRFK